MSLDRYARDQLFDEAFGKLDRGEFNEGVEMLRVASGADHLEVIVDGDAYRPSEGISAVAQVHWAARGQLDSDGNYSPTGGRPDPAALVFMGAESEFKGFIERRTGSSPDYRASGYVNHLGQAIDFYRQADRLGYPVARERLQALRLRLGGQDFDASERAWTESRQQWTNHMREERDRILGAMTRPSSPTSRVEIQGSTQLGFGNNPTVKVFWNGRQVGAMKSIGGKFAFDIEGGGDLLLKASFRTARLRVASPKTSKGRGGVARVYLAWDRTSGKLIASGRPIPERR